MFPFSTIPPRLRNIHDGVQRKDHKALPDTLIHCRSICNKYCIGMATIRRLEDKDVRSIFECLHEGRPPPPRLSFQIVPVGPNGLKLSPPSYEFPGTHPVESFYCGLRPSKDVYSLKDLIQLPIQMVCMFYYVLVLSRRAAISHRHHHTCSTLFGESHRYLLKRAHGRCRVHSFLNRRQFNNDTATPKAAQSIAVDRAVRSGRYTLETERKIPNTDCYMCTSLSRINTGSGAFVSPTRLIIMCFSHTDTIRQSVQ